MKLRLLLAVSATSLLAACQSVGDGDGVLGSAADPAQQQAVAVQEGRNPNANLRQINTQNALSDYCPSIVIRSGTETYRVASAGADTSNAADIRYQATITKAARECQYVGQELRIRVGARGRVITGPKGGPGTVELPIRVAVQEGDCSRHFRLERQQATIAGGSGFAAFEFVDDTIVMPAPTATNVRIFVGFDETSGAEPSAASCV